MDIRQLTGYYTYRSFINNSKPVNDFNQIKFAEAELYLHVQLDGNVTGMLLFPADPGTQNKAIMDITGRVENHDSSIVLEFVGQGRPNTDIFDFLYNYNCTMTYTWEKKEEWEKADQQKLCLVGTVIRAKKHGNEQAGVTASFIAVQRDFVEPKEIPEIAIIPSALKMIASKQHRLIHAVWHTLRGRLEVPPEGSRRIVTTWYILDSQSKNRIKELGWFLERPPFTEGERPSLILENGAGEDFLFMHRKMISMIRDEYIAKGIPYIKSWKAVSLPSNNIPQFVYSEKDDPSNPGNKIYQLDPLETGNMVPLPPYDPKNEDNNSIDFQKTAEFLNNVMRPMTSIYTNTRYLSALSLGALGNLIEFTIHGWMHNRWANERGAFLPDPKTGELKWRRTFDFDSMWDDPKYDYLGEFYSSHVNPLFWRLHGWVDDRIEDWFQAHESASPGEIERYEYDGASWFRPGKWVKVEKPFYWPVDTHHHSHDEHNFGDYKAIDNMKEVMDIIKAALQKQVSEGLVPRAKVKPVPGGSMNFILTANIEK
jgi:hypothetical protein